MQGLPPGRAGSPGLRHNPWAPLAPVWGRLRIRAGRAFTKEGTLDAEGFLSMVWMLPVGAKGGVGEVSPCRPPAGSVALSQRHLVHTHGPGRGPPDLCGVQGRLRPRG